MSAERNSSLTTTPLAGAPESGGWGQRFRVTFRALQHRNFRLFVIGQLISLIGTWMQMAAQAWLVYRITGSSLLLGSIGFVGQIPMFVLSPFGGVVADRMNRQRLVIATQASSMILAFVLAALTLTNTVQIWHIFVLAGLLGIVNAFDVPGRQAFLMDMVGREDLINAIGLNSSMFNGARIVGPAVAGILLDKLGEGMCFLVNGVSFISVIISLLMMNVRCRVRTEDESPWQSLVTGFRFVARAYPIRALLLLIAVVSLVGLPYSVLMPIFAAKILHGGPKAYGWLMGSTGIGAMFGALALASRSGIRGLGRWVAMAAGGFGVFLVLFSLSRYLWLSMALLIPLGFCMMLGLSSTNTLIQTMTPDVLRGRVVAVYSMMFLGMAPFGSFFGGAVADRLGASLTVALGGVTCLVAAVVFGLRLESFRSGARLLIREQELAGTTDARG
jgi:MFS family permease